MPLPAAAARKAIHRRAIDLHGYEREDGLWDIEGHLVDTKTYAFDNAWRGRMEPGDPVHEMWLRVTIDDDFVIQDIIAATDASPFRICPAITGNFQRLIGVRIGPGWKKAIRERVGGVEGCTHLVELLGPIGTVAFQTIAPMRERRIARLDKPVAAKPAIGAASQAPKRPAILDTCHALRADGPVVREHWPEHYTGTDGAA